MHAVWGAGYTRRAKIAKRDEHSFKVAGGPQALAHAATLQQTLYICCKDEDTQTIALGHTGQRTAGLTRLPDSTPAQLKRRFSCSGAGPRIVRVQSLGSGSSDCSLRWKVRGACKRQNDQDLHRVVGSCQSARCRLTSAGE